jgi:hypothetical protein
MIFYRRLSILKLIILGSMKKRKAKMSIKLGNTKPSKNERLRKIRAAKAKLDAADAKYDRLDRELFSQGCHVNRLWGKFRALEEEYVKS